jgi:hypothetical protein
MRGCVCGDASDEMVIIINAFLPEEEVQGPSSSRLGESTAVKVR